MEQSKPIHIYAIDCQKPETLHSPEYLLILSLNDGIRLHGATDQPLPSGTLLFLSPFSEQKLLLHNGSKALYAVISSSFLEPLMGLPKKAIVVMQPDGTNTAKEKLIELFDLQYNVSPSTQLSQMKAAMELLCALEPVISNETGSDAVPSTMNQRVAQMIKYLETHFREPVQLADLARAFSASRQYISTIFHRELGVPFSEYLLKLRLDEAVRLLLTTDQTITEIAEQSGFPNLKSLNQSFRAKYGASPKEYRQSKASVSAVIPRPPASNVLQDVNQLLRPYRLVYRKNEEAVRVADIIETGNGTPLSPHWDILNVDNCFECLQTSVQESLAQIQSHLHFRYVRLCNCLGYEMTPYIPIHNKHRFTYFFRLIEFFRTIGLTPMLLMGNNYQIMLDALMVSDGAYSASLPEWLQLLKELLEASIGRWGSEWVSTWRFEFHMPETLFGTEEPYGFMELFEQSVALIRAYLPRVQIGGPALSMGSDQFPRWNAWFQILQEKQLPLDFVSMELWADHTYKAGSFLGHQKERRELRTLDRVQNADTALATQKVSILKQLMKDHGYGDAKLYISAIGITKYRATAAQVGGHCAAYLVKCNLELNRLVDGIGCWKALNSEVEYDDEYKVFSSGCGLLSRYELKNINFYAYSFLAGLLPFELFHGLHCIATTDRRGDYAILIHNCKNYSEYFCRHYTDEKGLRFDDLRLYTSNVALEQNITLTGLPQQEYLFKQFLVGDHHGCIASVLLQLGRVRIPDQTEIEYVAGQSLPYQHAFTAKSDGSLQFSVTLQPNEVMLLLIAPENGACFF